MTERDMQNIVAATVQQARDLAIVPNCGALGHESDLLRVTDKRVVHEFEIKVSRSDFLADANKRRNLKFDERWQDIYSRRGRLPHYFWYAVTPGVAAVDDLPAHAGLIVVEGSEVREVIVEKRAKRLHSEVLPDRAFEYILRGQRIRYWQERDGINPLREARECQREMERQYRQQQREHREATEPGDPKKAWHDPPAT